MILKINKLHSISEVAKKIGLVDKKTKKPSNHTIRYWESEFKQIKPSIISGRRYYSKKDIELIMFIKYLLKNQGFSILGVKKIIRNSVKKVDEDHITSIKNKYFKDKIKIKSIKILNKIKQINKYGKKNSH